MLFEARNQRKPQSALPRHAPQPARTGYENYNDPDYIPKLEARSDIWGLPSKPSAQQSAPQQQQQPAPAPAKKMMSLDEVEAMMRAQTLRQTTTASPAQHTPAHAPPMPGQYQQPFPPPQPHFQHQQHIPFSQPPFPGMPGQYAPQVLQRPQQYSPQPPPGMRQPPMHAELPGHPVQPQMPRQQPQQGQQSQPAILQHQRATPDALLQQQMQPPQQPPSQPRQILQNPHRLAGPGQPMTQPPQAMRGSPAHTRGPSGPTFQGMVITHPEQLLQLSEEQRAAFLEEEAKRAKRNHKIALLSKDNGLMTPQDKNFITRIQLQQLMSATGNADEAGPEAALAEDFYYQVFSQIRGALRQTPNQPANQFAQTYLFQTNSRFGRRHGRGGDNHMQRMEQQVQRAVEAAKAKPKGKQLVIEGSLGKIAFSNSKTPRPLLNIKRAPTDDKHKQHKLSIADRKVILRNIENAYRTIMRFEDHVRATPPPINESSPPEAIQEHMEWRTKTEALHDELWQNTKIMEPINPQSPTLHPFIAMLSHAKGKKLIPRLLRHINDQERLTMMTILFVHLDALPVVSHGIATPYEPLSPAMREEVESFFHLVAGPLGTLISELPLNLITGLLALVLERTHIQIVARAKIGMALLTSLVSRAENIQSSTPEMDANEWQQWTQLYDQLFDKVEPVLPYLFPGTANDTDDHHIWQFLAAMGAAASPDQQQRLVLGVKDRVLEAVAVSKTLPPDMAAERLSTVNLFMVAIGLDVELLG